MVLFSTVEYIVTNTIFQLLFNCLGGTSKNKWYFYNWTMLFYLQTQTLLAVKYIVLLLSTHTWTRESVAFLPALRIADTVYPAKLPLVALPNAPLVSTTARGVAQIPRTPNVPLSVDWKSAILELCASSDAHANSCFPMMQRDVGGPVHSGTFSVSLVILIRWVCMDWQDTIKRCEMNAYNSGLMVIWLNGYMVYI